MTIQEAVKEIGGFRLTDKSMGSSLYLECKYWEVVEGIYITDYDHVNDVDLRSKELFMFLYVNKGINEYMHVTTEFLKDRTDFKEAYFNFCFEAGVITKEVYNEKMAYIHSTRELQHNFNKQRGYDNDGNAYTVTGTPQQDIKPTDEEVKNALMKQVTEVFTKKA